MRQSLYEKQQALLEIYQKLCEAEAESETSKTKVSHRQLMDEMKANLNDMIPPE
jgi:DNA-binding transcriptional regulator GbsR (MarR family)